MILKRAFDLSFAILLALISWPIILIISGLILLKDGGPVFYISPRMSSATASFGLIKFRTMRNAPDNRGVTGADKDHRITATGRWLRRTRLDELPQLWNIIRGDMSFVGPRPPLRRYVDMFPELYGDVLRARPGVTGLASLIYADHEGRLLARCTTAEETEAVYVRTCIPRKAKLDLLWQSKRSFGFDMWILWQTFRRRFGNR